MATVAPSIKKAVAEAAKLGEFTLGELVNSSGGAARAAVEAGYFKSTKVHRRTGKRGRPALIYKITDRGRKLVK